MAPRVLLTTTLQWPFAARLASAFSAIGAHVAALHPPQHVMAQSRFVSAHYGYKPLSPLGSLLRAIERATPDLVVPCDDRAVRHLLSIYEGHEKDEVGRLISVSLGSVESYGTILSRVGLIEAALREGIAAPFTAPVADTAELTRALGRTGLPAVLKADGSWGGGGVAVVRTQEEALAAAARLSSIPSRLRSLARTVRRTDAHFLRDVLSPPRASISIQRFVSGTPATTSFACWQGRVLATVRMNVLVTSYPTGPASVLQRVDCPQMEDAAHRVAARFALSGLHGLDFIRDDTGKVHLIELNPRATPASALALGPRHDLVAALARAISPSCGERTAASTQSTVALFPQEWRRDPHSIWLHKAHHDVPWDDPEVLRACFALRA